MIAVYASTTCGPCCSMCFPQPQRLYETFESADEYLRSTIAILEKVHKKTWEKLRFRASDVFDDDWIPRGKFLEDLERSRYITEGAVFPRKVLRVDRQLTDNSWLDRRYSEIDKNDENLSLVKTAVDEVYDEDNRRCSPYNIETYIKEESNEWPVLNENAGQRIDIYEELLQHVNSDIADRWIQCSNDAIREYDDLVTYILEQCESSSEMVKRVQWYKSRNLKVDDEPTLDAIRKNKELHEDLNNRIEAVFKM